MSEIERLYTSLVGLAPVGIFRTDADGHLVFANAALLQMAGGTADDLSDERWAGLHHPEDLVQVRKTWDEMRRGSLWSEALTYRFLRPDGSITWAHTRVSPLLDDAGALEGYFGVVTDITRERMFRNAAEKMQRLYATLSRVNAICAQATDRDSLFAAICAEIVEIGGFDYVSFEVADWDRRQLVIAHQAGRIEIHARDRRFDIDDPAQTNPGKLVLLKDTRLVFNDIGASIDVAAPVRKAAQALGIASVCGVPIHEGGRIVAALIIVATEKDFFNDEIVALVDEIGRGVSAALDNLERSRQKQQAEKALAHSEKLYSTLVEKAPVGVLQINAAGEAVYANDAMRALIGVDADEDLIAVWLAHIHPEDRPATEAYRVRMQADGGVVQLGYRLLRDDGSVVSLQVQGLPIPGESGEGHAYIVIVTDITAETALRARSERLSRLYATLSRINSILVKERDEATLFEQVCRAIVESGGFEHAAQTYVDWERRRIGQRHLYGGDIIPQRFRERDLDDPESQSIANLAVKSGTLVIINDVRNDTRLSAKIRVATSATPSRAAAAVPIRRGGEIVGTLTIVSSELNHFTAEIAALIEEIGRDVSFALDAIDQAQREREAKLALAGSEQYLNTTLRSIGDAVLVTDAAGRVTLLNPVAEALTGWREAEALGRPVEDVFHIVSEETRALAEIPVERVLREGIIVGLANHTILIARDGTERPIADSGAPIRYGEDAAIRGVVLVFRDQSEEYRMQKALRDSERLYATLAANVPVGVYLAGAEGELRYANEQFLKILGFGSEHLSIASAAAAIHPDDRERMAAEWFRACATREATDFGAYRYQYADGSICWVQGMVTPVFDAQGRLSCFAGVVKDITQERAHLEHIERLSRFNATVSQINAAIVRGGGEQALYSAITRIAVGTGQFDMANICAIDPDSGQVSLAAIDSTPALHELATYVARAVPEQRLSPATAKAIADKRRVVVNNIVTAPTISQANRDYARSVGLASVAAVPLMRFGEVVAVLLLSSRVADYFTDEILQLLDEITLGLSHALENLGHEQQRHAVEAESARNEERLRLALTANKIGIYEVEFATARMSLDAVCASILDIGETPMEVDLDVVLSLSTAREKELLYRLNDELYRELHTSYTAVSPRTLPDGSIRWVRHHGVVTAERSAQGKPVRVLGVMTDVTATKVLEERDRLAAKVFDNSSEAIMILNADKKVVMANQSSARVTGVDAGEILGQDAERFRPDFHDGMNFEEMHEILVAQGSWQGEVWRMRRNGEAYPVLASVSLLKDADGAIAYTIVQETDISAQKEFEQRIRHLAYRDALTELPNRTLLRDRVEQSIVSAARDGVGLALLFLDLDHFKTINDSLGHAVGDRLLREIAGRLSRSIREMDTVGRLGGDEFLILLPDGDADAAAHVAQKLLEECSRPFKVEPHALTVTPSIGVALYPKDGTDFDELLKSADIAMYRAKDEGRNAYRFYTPEMNRAVFQRMVLESSLRRAIDNNEFVLHYQPKFELRSRKLVGIEALIRWHQPDMGMISPAQFIPVAEESGLIEAIGTWVLKESLRQVGAWRDDGLPSLRVAVNFSARQFAAGNIIDLVTAALTNSGLSGDMLEVEITESLLAQDMSHTFEVLQALQQLGVHVAVDDFGTGYSSLSYLKRFPIDRLKIDQSFVRDLVTDADDRAIATAVVTMGHSLGMRVIAEGVETEQQMEILREMGCDEVQGYCLGRPISAIEMTRALRNYQAMFGTPGRN